MDTQTYDVLVEMGAFPDPGTLMKGQVTVLGKKYNLPHEKSAMSADIQSRLWCTYRKNFRAISGTSLTTDAGWGCTLRCGQMLMAQTLLCLHLGRDWKWTLNEDDPTYMRILRKFLDIRDSEYSLQMIALQGADFGRPVGNWFGPNNVAQAIRKLSVHDDFSKLAVHVAMDMVVVVEDMKMVCREPHIIPGQVNVTTEDQLKPRSQTDFSAMNVSEYPDKSPPTCRRSTSLLVKKTVPSTAMSRQHSEGQNSRLRHTVVKQNTIEELKAVKEQDTHVHAQHLHKRKSKGKPRQSIEFTKLDRYDGEEESDEDVPRNQATNETGVVPRVDINEAECYEEFRPLLVFIPLRLGQETFNMEYSESLRACLSLPQSVGFIGGKPRHALYFIGFHGEYLLYLDPHTTQQTVNPTDLNHIPDSTYHCSQADRMHISELDPSIALGFFCRDERDIDDLCSRLREKVVKQGMYTMFELTDTRPAYWGPLSRESFLSIREPFLLVDGDDEFVDPSKATDSDEEFEIIEWPPGPLCSIPPGASSIQNSSK